MIPKKNRGSVNEGEHKRKRRREKRRKREKEEMIPKRDRGGGMRGGDALGKSVGARRLI